MLVEIAMLYPVQRGLFTIEQHSVVNRLSGEDEDRFVHSADTTYSDHHGYMIHDRALKLYG